MNEPRSTPIEVHVSLIGRKDITNEIYRQLRAAILDGRLKSGDRLPPTRELAARLSVSRTTVMDVYDRLFSEGYTEARTGSGTRVSSELMRRRPHHHPRPRPAALGLDRHPGRSNARLSSTSGLARPTRGSFRTRRGGACRPGNGADRRSGSVRTASQPVTQGCARRSPRKSRSDVASAPGARTSSSRTGPSKRRPRRSCTACSERPRGC